MTLKVVRRRTPSSAEGTRGGKAKRGGIPPSCLGGGGGGYGVHLPPTKICILNASMFVFNGVLCFGDYNSVALVTLFT